MKKTMVVIDCRPDRWDVVGPFDTFTGAVMAANSIWAHLTEREKAGRYVAAGSADIERMDEEDFYDTFEEMYTTANDSPVVLDDDGELIIFESVVPGMDDEIRESVHSDLAPCSNQAFFDEYCKRHEEKYGVPFQYI